MLTTVIDTRCTACNKGTLILVGRPGRVVRHDGIDVEVPRDFLIPTCDHCGADRLDMAQKNELAAALAKSQLVALRSAPTQEMDPIGDDLDDEH
jgi:hypothetical protein